MTVFHHTSTEVVGWERTNTSSDGTQALRALANWHHLNSTKQPNQSWAGEHGKQQPSAPPNLWPCDRHGLTVGRRTKRLSPCVLEAKKKDCDTGQALRMYDVQSITTWCSASCSIYFHITLSILKLNLCAYVKESSGKCATTPTHTPCSSPDRSEVSNVASPPYKQTFKTSKLL